MTYEQAAQLVDATDGPVIAIRPTLIRRLDMGLAVATFVSQAAWLSKNAAMKANSEAERGWFFLEQEGNGAQKKEGLYKSLGSWEEALGLSKKEQETIRRKLREEGYLYELPTATAAKRNEQGVGDKEKAFMFTQRRGTPPRLFYRVDLVKYVQFLTGPAANADPE